MSAISNEIEKFLKSLLSLTMDGTLEIKRNELAEKFDCAPSQINYVLSTRFTPYQGYYIESKRGGGGFIKIAKVEFENNSDINEIILDTIGFSITKNKAFKIVDSLMDEKLINKREAALMKASLGDRSLVSHPFEYRNRLRADILKNMLLIVLMKE